MIGASFDAYLAFDAEAGRPWVRLREPTLAAGKLALRRGFVEGEVRFALLPPRSNLKSNISHKLKYGSPMFARTNRFAYLRVLRSRRGSA